MIKLTKDADRDIEDIYENAVNFMNYPIEAVESYEDGMYQVFDLLDKHPLMGELVAPLDSHPHYSHPIYECPFGKHIILYRHELDDNLVVQDVVILRILRQNSEIYQAFDSLRS